MVGRLHSLMGACLVGATLGGVAAGTPDSGDWFYKMSNDTNDDPSEVMVADTEPSMVDHAFLSAAGPPKEGPGVVNPFLEPEYEGEDEDSVGEVDPRELQSVYSSTSYSSDPYAIDEYYDDPYAGTTNTVVVANPSPTVVVRPPYIRPVYPYAASRYPVRYPYGGGGYRPPVYNRPAGGGYRPPVPRPYNPVNRPTTRPAASPYRGGTTRPTQYRPSGGGMRPSTGAMRPSTGAMRPSAGRGRGGGGMRPRRLTMDPYYDQLIDIAYYTADNYQDTVQA